ncbi:hypothetical protein BS78_02G018600 [Paspalum vaginatum]|nr:hypothetical protein BS78_02G018600 [Paspalum vaginatum]
MSDADIEGIQAPAVPIKTGRPRENRFPRMFEKKKFSRARRPQPDGEEDLAPAPALNMSCKLKPKPAPKKKQATPTKIKGNAKKKL